IQANKGVGLDRLQAAIARALENSEITPARPEFPAAFEAEVGELATRLDHMPAFLVRRLICDIGGFIECRLVEQAQNGIAGQLKAARSRLAEAGCPVPAVEARTRYAWIRSVTAQSVRRSPTPLAATDRIDRVLTHKLWGTLVFLIVMFGVFQAIFTGARPLMDWIGAGKDAISNTLRDIMPPGPFTSLLLDGVLEGVGSVVVFLPQIVILFGFIALLEDCGYMARAAFLMDKLMARCGLSGKSFIPMLSSVACAVPGIMATRVIED